MGKKDVLRSFNPDDFEVTEPSTVTTFNPDEFEVVSTPKLEVDSLTTFQEGQERDSKFNQIISEIPDMDNSRKESLKKLVKSGTIKGQQITDAILTYQGKHPKQSGGDSSKFYTDEKGIPHPLANNERPPKEYQINSIWGDQTDAEDDSPLTTLGKNVYNILPSIAENAIDLVHMPYGAVTGEEADWYKSLKNSANYLKAKTSSASNAPVLNTEGIDEMSDVFDPNRWNFTADNVAGTIGQIVKSVGEFGLGGGFISKAAGVTSKLGKGASLFTASYATQLGETIDRAKEAGLDTKDAYRVASAINVPIALVDLGLGVEGRMFKDELAKTGRKELVDNLVAGFVKDSEGKITKEGLDELFKSTLIANSALVKNWGKQTMGDIVGEGSQEAIQAFVQNAGEQLYDKMSDEEKAKFGTDAFSPKAFADYLQNFVVGAIGGAPSGIAVNKVKQITKDNEQSKTAFGLVQQKEGEDIESTNTRINSYKENIENEVRQGKLTREQADNAITRINAYKDYNDMLGSLSVDENEKRQLFDLSFQKQSLETEISQVKDPKKLNPIEQAQHASKEKLANDIQKNINEIIFNAQAKEETNLPKKTVEDIIKKENPPKKEGEKPKVPEHIQAILDRNKKETSKKEYPEETRSYEQIPNLEFNNPTKVSGGFRTIHKKAVEFLEKQPGKQILGKIVHKPFEYGGKKNKTYGVEMPDGKVLRFSSSMQRDEGFRGHMRTEHLVKEDELEGFPIGLKVEEIPSFEEGKAPKKVIKAFNANTGKFVGYMKETNTGKKIEYNQKQIDYLEHLGTVIEPPIIPPSEEEGGETVTPVKPTPTQPKGGTGVQIPTKEEYVESEIEALKSSEDNDYHPSLDNVYREALSKQYDAIHGTKEPVKIKVGSVSDLLNSVALYNRLNRGEKKSEQGVKMLRRIQDDANELGHSLRFIKKGKIQLLNEKGTQVYREGKIRSKDVIEAEKAEKAKLKKALNRTPQSIEHQVAMDIANGIRFNLDEFVRITGVQPKELNRLLFDKKGQSLEFYGTRLEEHGGIIPAGMDDVDIANEVAGIIESNYSGNNAIENAKKYALEVYEKEMNGGMTDAEVARMAESIGDKATQIIINTATNQTEEELIENNNKLKTAEDDKAENKTTEEIVSNVTGITEGTDNPFSEDFFEEKEHEYKGDIITGTYEEGEEPFQKSQELIYAENEFKKAEKELKAAKTAFDAKRKELGKEINNDQEDLFGERKSTEGAGLFDERVDMSAYEDVITPFKQRYEKAVQEFNKAKKKLDDLQNSEDSQMSLFQQEAVKAKKKEVDKIINHFKKVLSKDIKIIYDSKLKASGKWSPKTKTITINPKFAGKDTPIHEVGHILIDAMGGTDNRVIKAAIKQLEGTPLWEETARRYPLRKESIKIVNGNKVVTPAYTIDDLGKEVLAEAIGREGAGIFDAVSEQNKFKTYLNYIFDWLKRNLGLEKNIAKNLAKQVISGINISPIKITNKEPKQKTKSLDTFEKIFSRTDIDVNELGDEDKYDAEVVVSDLDATKRLEKGEILYTYHEQTEEPIAVTDISEYNIVKKSGYNDWASAIPLNENDVLQKNKTDITLEEYRTQKGRDLKQEQADLEALNDALENETDEDVIAQIENAIANIESNIENDTRDYEDFKKGIVKVKKVADATNLEGFTLDELIEAYHDAKNYDGFADKEMLNQAKMRIGQYLNQAGKDRLRALDKNIDEHANQRDLTKIEVWMKTLGHMSQDFPELQEFYKLFNEAVLKTQTDRVNKKSELERLGKEVIKEYNKKMGVKEWAKGLFTSNSAKYFEYLDNGKGQYLTPAEAKSKGLSKAQIDLLNFMRELVKERQAQDEDGNIIENEILKTDKGFRENWKDSGLVDAIVQYMGGANEETEIQHGGKKTTYKDAQKSIITDAKSGLKGKLLAFPKLLQIAYKAKKAGAKTNYGSLNYNGQLTSKFDQPRSKDKGYSKDFYSAAMSYIDDITHVKHMGKLVPLIDSIEQFYKYLGFEGKRPVGNTLKFIEQWKNEQIYQRTGEFDPIIDKALQFFRRLTSMTVMGFNYPAGVINIAIGNYNAWRAEGFGKWIKGQSRFFGGKDRAGLGTVNKKAIDVLNKYGVVSQDFDSNPKMFAGKLFDMLAFGATRFGEYQIQGSMFLGQLSPEEWSAFEYDKNGNLTVNTKKANMTEKAFETKMMQYRDRVSDVQGKYAEKDRRNFMRFEMGKSAGQFKVWIPDWFKERYGKEYIDANNVAHRGSWNMFTEQAIKDLKQDWSKHNIATAWKNKQMRQNLSGAITIAVLLIATHSDDEDKKKKREALSLENALQNLLFVYDLQQLKYMLESPIASWGTVNKFIDALDAALHGDTKKAGKTAKKLIPYNKVYDDVNYLMGNDKK